MAKQFGRYELVRELGRGGQAVVYEALDTELKRPVALKMLLPGTRSKSGLKRLVREARAAAKLNHRNIVSIYDVGEVQKRHYLAMEIVKGEPLDRVLDFRKPGAREAIAIVEQVAGAVHYAHENGVVHRDIKPANILTDEGGVPKLTDFGFAHDVAAQTQLTQSGAIMGTPSYMSPEQARGKVHQLDARSDVYSLGAVLYETLTGRPPFKAESSLVLLQKIVYEAPRRPSEIRRTVPADAETICLKCLAKEPERRYQTAAELAEDCRRFLAAEPILARAPSVFYLAKKKLARHKGVAVVSACAAVVLIGLATWAYVGIGRLRKELEEQTKAAKEVPSTGESPDRGAEVRRAETPVVPPRAEPFAAAAKPEPVEETPPQAAEPEPRTAAEAFRGAEEFERVHPEDVAGAIARFEAVARDFPGTPQAGKARINVVRLGSRAGAKKAAPASPARPEPKREGEWITIFNGRDLTGWKVHGEGGLEDGALVSRNGADLFYSADWAEFELDCEMKATGGRMTVALVQWQSGRDRCRVHVHFPQDGDANTGNWHLGKGQFPVADWLRVRFVVTGKKLYLHRGQELVGALDISRRPMRPGGLYFYGFGPGVVARMRNVRVRVLSREVKEGFLKTAPVPGEAQEEFAAFLAEFDKLVQAGDYVGARERMEREATKAENAGIADVLRAASLVAEALEDRQAAVRRAVEALVGQEKAFETSKGKQKGKVERVTDTGIELTVEIKKGRQILGAAPVTVAWAELTPEQEDELAEKGGWKPEGPDGAIARAYLAVSRDDSDAVRRALEEAESHPLAPRLQAKIRPPEPVAAERAAEPGWITIFNGRDLTGWKVLAPHAGGAGVKDGALYVAGSTDLYYPAEWTEFELSCELTGTNCVYLHLPSLGGKSRASAHRANVKIHQDGEVEVWCAGKHYRSPGGLFPIRDWVPLRVEMRRKALRFRRGDKPVWELDLPDAPETSGGVFFYSFPPESVGRMRNIRVRLISRETDDWLTIFNGKDLTGWDTAGGERAYVENEVFVSQKTGHFYYPADWSEFDLEFEVRAGGARADNVLYFGLGHTSTHSYSYRVRLLFHPDGQLDAYGLKKGKVWRSRPGAFPLSDWTRVTLKVRRQSMEILRGGAGIGAFDLKEEPERKGGLLFYAGEGGYTARFRNIRVRVISR